MKPIKADFDNAVRQPWSSHSCVVAQMAIRHGTTLYNKRGARREIFWRPDIAQVVAKTMIPFDAHFRKPGDELKPELIALRASLPDAE